MMTYLGREPFIHPEAVVTDSQVGAWAEVMAHSIVCESSIGDYSYVTSHCQIQWATIGKFVSIASMTRINPGNHPMWRITQHHFTYRSERYLMGGKDQDFFLWRKSNWVNIGHDAWLGHGCVVLPGRSIGIGAVVGAGSVVTRDVAPYTIVGGSPARPIRLRFPANIQAGLMELAWWDWDHEKLRRALPDIRSLDPGEFIAKYRKA